jgi:VWFA-related protein
MRHLCSSIVLLAGFTLPAAPVLAQATEQTLYVSALDPSGAPVEGLGPDAFTVKEDDRPREILRVSRATDPVDLVVLIDNSQAATPYINDLRRALGAFVTRTSNAHDTVALVALADRPTILADYTSNLTALQKGVDRIFAQQGAGMRLLDAIEEAAAGLQKREAARRVIVSITTDGAEFSNPNHQRVLEALRGSNAAYFAFVITRGATDLTSDEARSRGIVLDEGTRTTGGHLEHLLSSMGLRPALDGLATELEHQYQVVYSRPEALIPPKKISVSASRPGLTVRGTPAAAPTRPGA